MILDPHLLFPPRYLVAGAADGRIHVYDLAVSAEASPATGAFVTTEPHLVACRADLAAPVTRLLAGQHKGAKFSTFKAPYLRLSFPLSFRAHRLDRGDHLSSGSRKVDAFSDTVDRQTLKLK